MGFKIPKRTAEVSFADGHEYHGATVTFNLDLPMGFAFRYMNASLGSADHEAVLRDFGDKALTAWNIEDDDGNPIPANADGMLMAPPAFVLALMELWQEATQAVPAPLDETSTDSSGSDPVPLVRTGTQ
jgi:hypothetical protein